MNSTPCQGCNDALPDLLLAPDSAEAVAARSHIDACTDCRTSLLSLQETSALLDLWTAPDPSPWFDQRLYARLREEQNRQPEGFFERLRSRLLFSTGREMRPVLASALALVLAIGGGAAASLSHMAHPAPVQVSATVEDLQILDRDDQAIQTMDQLLQDDGTSDDNANAQPAS